MKYLLVFRRTIDRSPALIVRIMAGNAGDVRLGTLIKAACGWRYYPNGQRAPSRKPHGAPRAALNSYFTARIASRLAAVIEQTVRAKTIPDDIKVTP